MTIKRFNIRTGADGCTVTAKISHPLTPSFIAFLREDLGGKAFSATFNQTDPDGFAHDRFELSSIDYPGVNLEELSARFD